MEKGQLQPDQGRGQLSWFSGYSVRMISTYSWSQSPVPEHGATLFAACRVH